MMPNPDANKPAYLVRARGIRAAGEGPEEGKQWPFVFCAGVAWSADPADEQGTTAEVSDAGMKQLQARARSGTLFIYESTPLKSK